MSYNRVIDAFRQNKASKAGNTHTNGQEIFLFGQKICWKAHKDGKDGFYISDCGFRTRTTLSRLKLLPIHVETKKEGWFINGDVLMVNEDKFISF